jgi:hypothetical protein
MTTAHVNRWWTGMLELFVVFHGATVAWFAVQGQGGPNWAQFLFGGLGIFVVTQMHGVALKAWHKWLFAAVVVSTSTVYYALHTEEIIGLARTVPTRYVFVLVLAALIWLVMRPFARGRVRSD